MVSLERPTMIEKTKELSPSLREEALMEEEFPQ